MDTLADVLAHRDRCLFCGGSRDVVLNTTVDMMVCWECALQPVMFAYPSIAAFFDAARDFCAFPMAHLGTCMAGDIWWHDQVGFFCNGEDSLLCAYDSIPPRDQSGTREDLEAVHGWLVGHRCEVPWFGHRLNVMCAMRKTPAGLRGVARPGDWAGAVSYSLRTGEDLHPATLPLPWQ